MNLNWHDSDDSSVSTGRTEAEDTLRLLAQLPPPEGLSGRVLHRLAVERAAAPRRSFWSLWLPMQRVQYAGAALLVVAVIGSTWSVYHVHPATGVTPSHSAPSAGFGSAGAERRPATIAPIKVPEQKAVVKPALNGQSSLTPNSAPNLTTGQHKKPSPSKVPARPTRAVVTDGDAGPVGSTSSSGPRQ